MLNVKLESVSNCSHKICTNVIKKIQYFALILYFSAIFDLLSLHATSAYRGWMGYCYIKKKEWILNRFLVRMLIDGWHLLHKAISDFCCKMSSTQLFLRYQQTFS